MINLGVRLMHFWKETAINNMVNMNRTCKIYNIGFLLEEFKRACPYYLVLVQSILVSLTCLLFSIILPADFLFWTFFFFPIDIRYQIHSYLYRFCNWIQVGQSFKTRWHACFQQQDDTYALSLQGMIIIMFFLFFFPSGIKIMFTDNFRFSILNLVVLEPIYDCSIASWNAAMVI